MRRNFRSPQLRTAWLVSTALATLGLIALLPSLSHAKAPTERTLEPKEYDRLDGHGATGKKVDVIEWEGNLELHVYPKGSLKSLGMKIDHESKTSRNAVMVIEYGFNGVPYTLIRRAVLSISMPDLFHAFRDETAEDYDKIIVTGHVISGGKEYALQPPPTQLYPDYHPALAKDDSSTGAPAKTYQRKTSSEGPPPSGESEAPGIQFRSADEVNQDDRGTLRRRTKGPSNSDDEGGIKNFAF